MTSSFPGNQAFPWRTFALVLFAALVIRAGAMAALAKNLAADPDGYRQIAEGLLATGVYTRGLPEDAEELEKWRAAPTAYRPPLYPLVLSGIALRGDVKDGVVAVLHVVLGVAAVGVTFVLARKWLPDDERGAVAAALLVALDPILLNQAVLVMTETLATLLAVVALWLLSRVMDRPSLGNAAAAGIVLGLAALCRPTFLPWAIVAALALWQLPVSRWRRTGMITTVLLATAALLAPWTVRNYVYFQRPIATTTHGGYTLALGNNAAYYDWLSSGKDYAWPGFTSEELPRRCLKDELRCDDYWKQRGWQSISNDPAMALYASALRIVHLWSPLPQKTSPSESTYRLLARWGIALWYSGVYFFALSGAWKLRDRLLNTPWLWGVILCLVFTGVHTLYWSNLRMRAPLVPVIALLAGAAISRPRSHPL